MLSHWLSTFGLFARRMSKVVPAFRAIASQLSPDATTCVTSQSCPVIPRQSGYRGHVSVRTARGEERRGKRRTSPMNRLSQLASTVALFTVASW